MLPYDLTRENYSRLGYVYEGFTTYYGDYMLLPSQAARKHAQHAYFWDITKDYSNYVGENDKSQEKDLV